ncbi:hypothetical protein BDV39DRAFT_119165 [Aspergillus sergii]|uniref:Uncharacterized protein n=1 Tax=Aspergillus sergii TaxID=1034303 RepID=A0A5N6WX02_9EURO|nr:hypothetical protein BDV39DRAFT_119165 [Aspergillus sergii]
MKRPRTLHRGTSLSTRMDLNSPGRTLVTTKRSHMFLRRAETCWRGAGPERRGGVLGSCRGGFRSISSCMTFLVFSVPSI